MVVIVVVIVVVVVVVYGGVMEVVTGVEIVVRNVFLKLPQLLLVTPC